VGWIGGWVAVGREEEGVSGVGGWVADWPWCMWTWCEGLGTHSSCPGL
jgi:hypothetical protein